MKVTRGYGYGPVNPALWEQWEQDEPDDIRRMGSIYNIFEESTDLSNGALIQKDGWDASAVFTSWK